MGCKKGKCYAGKKRVAFIFEMIKLRLHSEELLKICKINPESFTRNRSLTFVNLTVFILNFIKKSLQIELYNFADSFSISSVTKQAFSKARKKLSPMVFQLLNQKLTEEFYTDNIIKKFNGLRVLAIDGSVLRLPSSSELHQEYGGDKVNCSIPLARTSIMFDVLNQLTVDATVNPYSSSERDLALQHIEKLNQQKPFADLLIFDRGYPSLFFIFFLSDKKKHFLMRVQESFLLETNVAVKSGLRDSIVTISAFKQDRKNNPNFKKYLSHLSRDSQLQVRVLVYDLPNGKTEIIVTSLINQDDFSYDDIFSLYSRRWGIEEGYKFYKSIAEMENFSGKSKLAIEQDFFATILSCNMAALLMQEAQDELEQSESPEPLKYEYKINRNILVGIIKNEIIDVLLGDNNLNEYCEALKKRIKKNLVPIRPNRNFPRIFKRIRSSISWRAL